MTQEQTALGLIERLEAASGPDRELDKAIARACGFAVEKPTGDLDDRDYVSRGPDSWWGYLPRYTASLDAALTLVPRHCDVRKFTDDPSGTGWTLSEFANGTVIERGKGLTAGLPAIALCIAALKARGIK